MDPITVPAANHKLRVHASGRIDYVDRWSGKWIEKVLKPGPTGYIQIQRYHSHEKYFRFYVHVLVAELFLCKPETDLHLEVDHLNRIRHDNRVENLEWVTRSENALRKMSIYHGASSWSAKLTHDKVRNVLHKYYILGESQKHILNETGVTSVQAIVEGKSWVDVPRPIKALWHPKRLAYYGTIR